MTPRLRTDVVAEVEGIVSWYLSIAYGRWEGPGTTPFFADTRRVGPFAVAIAALRSRDSSALFKVLITLSSYQSRRDVDIMAMQRTMRGSSARELTSPQRLRVLSSASLCRHLRGAEGFDRSCDVRRDFVHKTATCATRPRASCHVKDATMAIGRMGDMGKMPTSAILRLPSGGLGGWFAEACAATTDPNERAAWLVDRVSSIYLIGRKLASMFVSAMSVVELYGIAPWAPEVDGSRIVVIDANVARAIRSWRRDRGANTYDVLTRWLIAVADRIDLSRLRSDLPPRSPRLVQQAIYLFRSRSNRAAHGDTCASRPCATCPSRVCPFRDRGATSTPGDCA